MTNREHLLGYLLANKSANHYFTSILAKKEDTQSYQAIITPVRCCSFLLFFAI